MQVQTSTSARLELIRQEADRRYDDLVALRRDIHAHPEVGHEEYRTTQVVVDTLTDIAGTPAEDDVMTEAEPLSDNGSDEGGIS